MPSFFFSVLTLAGGVLGVEWFIPSTNPPWLDYLVQPGCRVKGNISYQDGTRLYYSPDMVDYETLEIAPRRGEKWFCSEADAQASGWSQGPN